MTNKLGDLRLNINFDSLIEVENINEALSIFKKFEKHTKIRYFDLEIYESIDGERNWNTWHDEETGNIFCTFYYDLKKNEVKDDQ